MAAVRQFDGWEQVRLPDGPLHLAIGMFDGVHLGHQAVIQPAVQAAQADGGTAAVLTFAPHPSRVLHPQRVTRLIMPPEAKARVLGGLGVQAMITQPFTREFAHIPAAEFLPMLQRRLAQLRAVYVGDNWRFGAGRRGDVVLLRESAARLNLRVTGSASVLLDGQPVSSTRIREALLNGDLAQANRLLGYTYFAIGQVVPGKQLGRRLGFPTLNLDWVPELRPRYGVYVVRLQHVDGSNRAEGVASYGVRPTVEQTDRPCLETHVLGDCPFDRGDQLVVEWAHFLRPELRFDNVASMRAQIARDCDDAANWLKAHADAGPGWRQT